MMLRVKSAAPIAGKYSIMALPTHSGLNEQPPSIEEVPEVIHQGVDRTLGVAFASHYAPEPTGQNVGMKGIAAHSAALGHSSAAAPGRAILSGATNPSQPYPRRAVAPTRSHGKWHWGYGSQLLNRGDLALPF
jgi:hypothetical protein